MASQQDDDIHEGTPGYTLSQPKQSLAAYQEMATVRSRSVSLSVPAPPPPSPYAYDLDEYDEKTDPGADNPTPVLVTAINLEELLRLLYTKTNTPVPSLSAWQLSPSLPSVAAAVPVPDAAAAAVDSVPLSPLSGYLPSTSSDDSNAPTLADDSTDDVALGSDLLTLPGLGCVDANDESLQKYKASLGLGAGKDLSDPNDPRVCIIQSLTMESPGRDPVVIDLSAPGSEATLKDKPFTIKEGARFTMVAAFKVQHEVLSGLRYVQVVKRKGVRVSKDSEMIGSYAPNTDKQPLYTKRFQEDEAPSGMLVRGHYVANSSFIDDDKKTHLSFEWSFDISKEW